jgi:large subunit ribosomal protein L21
VKIGEKMVYAIVECGGKQYKAIEGKIMEVDLLPDNVGQEKVVDKVLAVVNNNETLVGSPYLKDVEIKTVVKEHFKGEKITVFNYRAKERYRVKTGHRQKYSRLLVTAINFPGKQAEPEKPADTSEQTKKSTKSKKAS